MRICKVEGCNNNYYCKDYCAKHYQKYKKYGDPLCTKAERHGMMGTPEYISWAHMKERCYNQKHHAYPRYGGRGIMVCKRWRDSFLAFYNDMGKRPFPKAQIDRINNDGNYESSNCRWVSQVENCRNGSWTKLSMQKAKEIRNKYKAGNIPQKTLGLIYGVGQDNISRIINNKRWV